MLKTTLTLSAFVISGLLMAQSKQISFGADMSIPMGEFGEVNSFGIGPAVGFEYPVQDRLGLTAQLAYQFVSSKSDYKESGVHTTMMPLQVGAKYYFEEAQQGFYGQAQLGLHTVAVHGMGLTLSSTNFSFAFGAGYQLEKLDFGLRINRITSSFGGSTYLGIRAAYLLNLD